MKQNQHIAEAATRKLLVTLGAAVALGALMLLPVAVRAQDDQVGTNAPHQERNPSAHPELWSR